MRSSLPAERRRWTRAQAALRGIEPSASPRATCSWKMAIKRPAEPSSPSSTAREAPLQLGRPHGDSRPHAVRPDRAGKEQGRPAREGWWSEALQGGMCAASARHIVHHRTCAAARGHGLDMGRTPRRRQSKTLAGRRGALSGAASGGSCESCQTTSTHARVEGFDGPRGEG